MTIDRESVLVDPGTINLNGTTQKVWRVIADQNNPERLFLWGNGPARLIHFTVAVGGDPLPAFEPLSKGQMTHEAARAVKFVKPNKSTTMPGAPAFLEIAPPMRVIENLIATPIEEIPLPRLYRIARAPVFSPIGELQTTPGYHASTGVYLLWKGAEAEIGDIPPNPTDADIVAARELLFEPLQDFPFRSEQDRAHAIALEILPFVRECIIGPTPLHLFNKPAAGTGATLLVNTLLAPSVGRQHGKLVEQKSDEEWAKVITSLLLAGPSVTVIDNVRKLTSPVLAQAITSDIWDGRRLGKSEMLNLAVRTAWAATGNNVMLHSEIQRRVIAIQLDSGLEDPSMGRDFAIKDLNSWLDSHRIELMRAILILVQAWFARGCPSGKRRLGGFENWSEIIGGILDVAGINGFLSRMERSDTSATGDLEKEAHRWLVRSWWQRHNSTQVLSRTLAEWAMATGSPFAEYMVTTRERSILSSEHSTVFGVHLRSVVDRVFTFQDEGEQPFSLQIVRGKALLGSARWQLKRSAGHRKLHAVSLCPDDAVEEKPPVSLCPTEAADNDDSDSEGEAA